MATYTKNGYSIRMNAHGKAIITSENFDRIINIGDFAEFAEFISLIDSDELEPDAVPNFDSDDESIDITDARMRGNF